MFYVVEIQRNGEHLGMVMSRIREWLDARRSEPEVFRCDTNEETVTLRLEFKSETEALACAETFGGHLR